MLTRSTTARSRAFGVELDRLIKRAGFTGHSVATFVGWDPSKISTLKNGKGGASEAEVMYLLGVCMATPDERDRVMDLYQDMHHDGWWQKREACVPVKTIVEQIGAARRLTSWQANMVPELLQVPDYARAVIMASPNVPADQVDERVQAQVDLWALLLGRKCTFYINEQALRLPVGGRRVRREQLQYLVLRPDTEVRVVPEVIGAHAGMCGSFTQLTFDDGMTMVYVDGESFVLLLEDDAACSYKQTIRSLDEISLDVENSKAFLVQLEAEL